VQRRKNLLARTSAKAIRFAYEHISSTTSDVFSVKEQVQKFSDDYITTLEKMYRLKEKDLLKV
jgi:ribosome recycling factor